MAQSTQSTRKPWRETPLIESANLSKAAGCRIFLKLENLQPSGSFKSRGIGLFVQRSLERSRNPDKVHFYSSSSGNAGLGAVHAANFVQRPSTVVVPLTTKPFMVAKIRAAGATQVVQHGAHWKEADTYMREVVMREAAAAGEEPISVHPFDHPDLWEGHSSLVEELRRQMPRETGDDSPPDLIVCSVGGGGLFNGVVRGVQAQTPGWLAHTRILAMETLGADALAQSLDADEHVTLPAITSIATSLGAIRVSEQAFKLAQAGRAKGTILNAVLTDAEAAMGCWRLADDERLLVDIACGVNVAICYGGRLQKILGRPVKPTEKIVIVLCGGSGISVELLEAWRQEFGDLGDGAAINGDMAHVPSQANVPT